MRAEAQRREEGAVCFSGSPDSHVLHGLAHSVVSLLVVFLVFYFHTYTHEYQSADKSRR